MPDKSLTPSTGGQSGGAAGNTPGGSSPLSANQLYDLATQAGFVGDDAKTAVAVALAESQGNPNAYNPETAAGTPQGMGSYGLWQIYLKVHPEFRGWNLYDPIQNAIAAFSVYCNAGSGFEPWSTYKNNAYEAYLPEVEAAVNA